MRGRCTEHVAQWPRATTDRVSFGGYHILQVLAQPSQMPSAWLGKGLGGLLQPKGKGAKGARKLVRGSPKLPGVDSDSGGTVLKVSRDLRI